MRGWEEDAELGIISIEIFELDELRERGREIKEEGESWGRGKEVGGGEEKKMRGQDIFFKIEVFWLGKNEEGEGGET